MSPSWIHTHTALCLVTETPVKLPSMQMISKLTIKKRDQEMTEYTSYVSVFILYL
jgi:hypothetical protein